MTRNRLIYRIFSWWRKLHPSLRKLPEWKRAEQALSNATRRGCTQDIRRAKDAMKKAVHDDLRRSGHVSP